MLIPCTRFFYLVAIHTSVYGVISSSDSGQCFSNSSQLFDVEVKYGKSRSSFIEKLLTSDGDRCLLKVG